MTSHDTLPPFQPIRDGLSPLRKRILEESAAAGRRKRKRKSQEPPKWKWKDPLPGQARFDLNKDMEPKPYRSPTEGEASKVVDDARSAAQLKYFASSPKREQTIPPAMRSLASGHGVDATVETLDPIQRDLDELSKVADVRGSVEIYSNGAPDGEETASLCGSNSTQHESRFLLPPNTRPITTDQLISEVKGIYAGLIMVESKCIEIERQRTHFNTKLSIEQWNALMALHRTLLYEHHDFFLATQHPAAPTSLRQLARKYAMPARMWRHGIQDFLDLMRFQSPTSMDDTLSFISLAYSMLTQLHDYVPDLEEEWADIMGSLQEYRHMLEKVRAGEKEIYTDCLFFNSDPVYSHAASNHQQEFGDWYFDSNNQSPDFPQDELQDQDAKNHMQVNLSDHILLAMSGWLYFGQKKSFNTFCKVFKLLAFTALFSW